MASHCHRRTNGVSLGVIYGVKWKIYIHGLPIRSFKSESDEQPFKTLSGCYANVKPLNLLENQNLGFHVS